MEAFFHVCYGKEAIRNDLLSRSLLKPPKDLANAFYPPRTAKDPLSNDPVWFDEEAHRQAHHTVTLGDLHRAIHQDIDRDILRMVTPLIGYFEEGE